MGAKQKLTSDLTKVMTEGLDPKKDKKAMDDLKKYAKNVAKAISKFATSLTTAPAMLVDNNGTNVGETLNTELVALADVTGGATIMEKALITANMGANPPSSVAEKYSKGVAKAIKTYSTTIGLGPSTIFVPTIPVGTNTETPQPAAVPLVDTSGGAIGLQKDLIKLEGTAIPYAAAVATAISTYFLTLVVPGGSGLLGIVGPAPGFLVIGKPGGPVAISEG